MKWMVPVTIVEYGREVLVEADTKGEAIRIARSGGWDDGGDAASFKITVVGAAHPASTEEGKK
jgi:hypothetical protein